MIRLFLRERLSWLLFFLFSQFLVVLIGYLDATISLKAVGYSVFLTSLLFLLFTVVRYHKETRFYKELRDHSESFDLTTVPAAASPFEKITSDMMEQQNETHKSQVSELYTSVAREKDDTLRWIHEIKTPLTTMQLMIDRIEDASLRSQLMYEWLRMHLLLDQQLHQKRIPFISHDLFIEQKNLETLLYQEIRTLKLWCMQKRIGFDVNLDETNILTDAKWFGFLIRQILTNAVKYSEASDIMILSWIKDGRTNLSIRDYGRGIDAKDLPRIFDQGFTNTTFHQDNASTGMGLYLAKQTANALHIDIHVESVLGEGTEFTLTLPRKNDFVDITGM